MVLAKGPLQANYARSLTARQLESVQFSPVPRFVTYSRPPDSTGDRV